MDKDIIWVTFRGRHIPIKKGMIGKFKKKALNDKENDNKNNTTKENVEKDTPQNDKSSFVRNSSDKKSVNERYDEVYAKLNEVESKISKIEKNDEKYIDYEGRKIRVTGLGTDYEDPKIKRLNDLADSYRNELSSMRDELRKERGKDDLKNVKLKSLSDIQQYLIDRGYSKATALKLAREYISSRKGK